MPKILLEGDVFEFVPDRTKLTEALKTGRVFPLPIAGRFSVCDSVNGNNRRYPKRVWEKNLQQGSPLQKSIAERSSFGLLEHPKDGVVSLLSPISHVVTKARMTEGNDVDGEITLVNTAEGQKLTALIEAGYNPKVSSRGYGSVERGPDGVDEVQDDFVCEAWDAVFNPSFKSAELKPQRESAAAPTATLTETAPARAEKPVNTLFAEMNAHVNAGRLVADSVRIEGDRVIVERKLSTPAAPAPSTTETRVTTTMDIKQIRESINALTNVDASKLDPRRLAEGLTQMQNLHRETAAVVAQDSKLSWDGSQVHDDLTRLEQAWTEAAKAPAVNVTKLQEQQTKVVKILHEVASTGLKFRQRLAETLKKLDQKKQTIAEVAKRGNDWRKRCLAFESKGKLQEKRLALAYASLDEFTARYHADTAALASAMVKLEHKVTDAAILKRLTEAKRVEEVHAIRDEITGKKPAAPAAAAVAPVAPAAAAPVAPAPLRIESTVRQFTVSEAVASTKRLSESSALVG